MTTASFFMDYLLGQRDHNTPLQALSERSGQSRRRVRYADFVITRRNWLAGVPATLAAGPAPQSAARPNVLLVISDQFRADCIGAMGANPMNLTPGLDAMASRGVLFRSACANQPVCAPARASIFTGQYPARHGVWRNGPGLREDSLTLAGELRRAGYSANYIGKWHLAPNSAANPETHGAVAAANRGGFLDLWEAANQLEHTSNDYEGDLYGADGKPIHFSGQYRSDFMTARAQNFLRSVKQPFFLTVSYLEVHHQNDVDAYLPPKEYKGRYPNPFIPEDLRRLPGSWPGQLSDYYACVAKMDDNVNTLRKTLNETGLAANTIVVFTSDHGCHFKTRNTEYKRSPHDSSVRIPLIVEGPGFNRSMQLNELVSQVDLAPTLLEAAGIPIPQSMQGRSFLRMMDRRDPDWRNEVYFEMSEYWTGRGLRTPQYTYAVAAPKQPGWRDAANAARYAEFALYDNFADPHQQVNLIGRDPYRKIADGLKERLRARMLEAGDPPAAIDNAWFPYPT
jgi:arylsulfatase A-like enzyme